MSLLARPPSRMQGNPILTEADFARIADYAHREFGLYLPPGKLSHVRSRLVRFLHQTEAVDFPSLCDRLDRGPTAAERQELISALTTNVTQFFREEHHFQLLTTTLLKPHIDALRAGKRLRIWSAGCSAGQEPASIAMTILHHLPETARPNIRVLGTDIDASVILQAQRGVYPIEELQGIPPHLRAGMVELDRKQQSFQLSERVRKMIHFAELNLMSDWPIKGPFDAIFCRNVAIYFDKPTQSRLWSRFADLLAPGGILMIGHSERVSGPAGQRLKNIGLTSYQRSEGGSDQLRRMT